MESNKDLGIEKLEEIRDEEKRKKWIAALRKINDMTEEQRIEYISQVFHSLIDAIMKIKGKSKIEQIKIATKLQREIEQKQEILLTLFIYTVKPEYRPLYLELVTRALGKT